MFRATSQTVYLKNSTCSGATYSFSIPTASARSVIGTVPDMKGSDDGVRDILLFDPDTMTWYRYYSQWNAPFVGQPAINFGAVGAVAL